MTYSINELGSVRFGTHAKALKQGPLGLVQSSAIRASGMVARELVARAAGDAVRFQQKDLLEPGDVLLIGKGPRNAAAVWQGGDTPTLAASMLYVIKPRTDRVLPGYLAGYLNSVEAQAVFATHAKVGTVKVLGRKALDELRIPVPSLEEQRLFVQIADAAQREQLLLDRLKEQHQQLIRSVWASLTHA